MGTGRSPLAGATSGLLSGLGIALLVAVLGFAFGFRWAALQIGPSLPEFLLALATVLVAAASATVLARERARWDRMSGAAAADLAREQSMFRDELAQRLDSQRQLRESDARLRAIVDGAPVVLFAIDLDGVITFCAGTGPDPLGKKPGESVGWPAAELFGQHPEVVRAIHDALSGSGGQVGLTGEDRWFSISLAPFRDATGKTAGAIAVAVDVSERRRAEQALRESVDTLQRVDRDRRALLNRLVRAQEEERRRIASDIHDDSIQSLFAVGIRLHLLRAGMKDPQHLELLDRLQQTIDQTTHRLRHLLFELRPSALDEGGLAAALREYLQVMQTESGIEVQLDSGLPLAPGSDAQAISYRIAQEALTNVRKHAEAHRVTCAIFLEDGGILTRITDDGRGFEVAEVGTGTNPGHLGLVAMQERAETAGGWLRIESAAGNGTALEFWIPETKEAEARAA